MWEIAINAVRFPAPLKRFPEDQQIKYANDLMVISNEVHAVLTKTVGVTRLRWWFAGWDASKPGVRTPAQLPWRVDASELAGPDLQKSVGKSPQGVRGQETGTSRCSNGRQLKAKALTGFFARNASRVHRQNSASLRRKAQRPRPVSVQAS